MEVILVVWVFGIDRLNTLMKLRTGETMPKFITYVVKFFIPVFVTVIFLFLLVSEFKESTRLDREKDGWNTGLTWLGRMIMFIPMLMVPIGFFLRLPCVNIEDVVLQQYGVKVNKDGTYDKNACVQVELAHFVAG